MTLINWNRNEYFNFNQLIRGFIYQIICNLTEPTRLKLTWNQPKQSNATGCEFTLLTKSVASNRGRCCTLIGWHTQLFMTSIFSKNQNKTNSIIILIQKSNFICVKCKTLNNLATRPCSEEQRREVVAAIEEIPRAQKGILVRKQVKHIRDVEGKISKHEATDHEGQRLICEFHQVLYSSVTCNAMTWN